MFLKAFINSTVVTLELVYVELSQSTSREKQNLIFFNFCEIATSEREVWGLNSYRFSCNLSIKI